MQTANDIPLISRQTIVLQVVRRLEELKPQTVQICLLPCSRSGLTSARGYISSCGKAAPPNQIWTREGDAFLPAKLPPDLPILDAIRIGEFAHLCVENCWSGYLHVFNIGTNGGVRRLTPPASHLPKPISENRPVLVTPNGAGSIYMAGHEPCRELGDSGGNELGRANGYPERVLAMVTAKRVEIETGDLHPDWKSLCAAGRAATSDSWTQGEVTPAKEPRFPSRLAPGDWAWGLVEAKVET